MSSVLLFIMLLHGWLGVHSAPAQHGARPADVQQDSGTALP